MLGFFDKSPWVVERKMTGLDPKKAPSISLHIAQTMSRRQAQRWAKKLNQNNSWHWPCFSSYKARPATQLDLDYISREIGDS